MKKHALIGFCVATTLLSSPSSAAEQDIFALLEKEELPVLSMDAGDASWRLVNEYYANTVPTTQAEISERAWLDQDIGMKYMDVKEDLTLREIDNKALELVKEFQKATGGASRKRFRQSYIQLLYA